MLRALREKQALLAEVKDLAAQLDQLRVCAGADCRSAEEALCGGKDGTPDQFPAAFRARSCVRQESAQGDAAARLKSGIGARTGPRALVSHFDFGRYWH